MEKFKSLYIHPHILIYLHYYICFGFLFFFKLKKKITILPIHPLPRGNINTNKIVVYCSIYIVLYHIIYTGYGGIDVDI